MVYAVDKTRDNDERDYVAGIADNLSNMADDLISAMKRGSSLGIQREFVEAFGGGVIIDFDTGKVRASIKIVDKDLNTCVHFMYNHYFVNILQKLSDNLDELIHKAYPKAKYSNPLLFHTCLEDDNERYVMLYKAMFKVARATHPLYEDVVNVNEYCHKYIKEVLCGSALDLVRESLAKLN